MAKSPSKGQVAAKAETGPDTPATVDEPAVAGAVSVSEAWSLELDKVPFVVGQVAVKKFTVASITFVEFEKVVDVANTKMVRAKSENNRKFFTRERMVRQLRAWDVNGASVPLNESDLLNIPACYAAAVTRAGDAVVEPMGEILSDGDGIQKPVLYKFGTPLQTGGAKSNSGDASASAFTEIEIQARTLGDIEDVLAGEGKIEQALALVRQCARPIGGPVQLERLPSWATDAITLTDGLIIMDKILPRFLQ